MQAFQFHKLFRLRFFLVFSGVQVQHIQCFANGAHKARKQKSSMLGFSLAWLCKGIQ